MKKKKNVHPLHRRSNDTFFRERSKKSGGQPLRERVKRGIGELEGEKKSRDRVKTKKKRLLFRTNFFYGHKTQLPKGGEEKNS